MTRAIVAACIVAACTEKLRGAGLPAQGPLTTPLTLLRAAPDTHPTLAAVA